MQSSWLITLVQLLRLTAAVLLVITTINVFDFNIVDIHIKFLHLACRRDLR